MHRKRTTARSAERAPFFFFEANVYALDRSCPRTGEVTERRLGAAFGVQPTAFRGAPAQVRAEQASVERTD